jgi:hypothetical protein
MILVLILRMKKVGKEKQKNVQFQTLHQTAQERIPTDINCILVLGTILTLVEPKIYVGVGQKKKMFVRITAVSHVYQSLKQRVAGI